MNTYGVHFEDHVTMIRSSYQGYSRGHYEHYEGLLPMDEFAKMS